MAEPVNNSEIFSALCANISEAQSLIKIRATITKENQDVQESLKPFMQRSSVRD